MLPMVPSNLDLEDEENFLKYVYQMQQFRKQQENSYKYLQEMCQVKNVYPSYAGQVSPLTNRAIFIIDKLNSLNIKYTLDIFTERATDVVDYFNPKLINIIVEFNSHLTEEPATMFCAHHDVVNVNSDNAQDNSASVCNLLFLCKEIKAIENFNKRVIVIFTDREEYGGVGAKRMSDKINDGIYNTVGKIYNLELTGLGDLLWIDTNNFKANKTNTAFDFLKENMAERELLEVSTPFSDAVIFRREGLDAVCIGILPEEDRNSKSTWRLCHSTGDTFEKTNEQNMVSFVQEVLLKLI